MNPIRCLVTLDVGFHVLVAVRRLPPRRLPGSDNRETSSSATPGWARSRGGYLRKQQGFNSVSTQASSQGEIQLPLLPGGLEVADTDWAAKMMARTPFGVVP